MTSFNGKTVLITGATSGIGKALTLDFLSKGAIVCICARNKKNLEELVQQVQSNKLHAFACDVSKEEDCRLFVEQSLSVSGKIDVLINNAGISMRASFQDLDPAVLKQCMDINFWGTVYCTKYALPHILRQQGSIVGISSIAGYKGLPCRTGYSASKFAMQGFLESLRIEMLYKGVHVMWVAPGFVASNIRNVALNASGNAQSETPLDEKKLMTAEECASRIIKAIMQRKRTLIMSVQGKLTVWMNRFFPSFVDKMVYRHFANEADSPLK